MMSGPPRKSFEDSSLPSESERSQGISGEEARSFGDRASLAQSRQNHRNLSSFLAGTVQMLARASLRELLLPATPQPGLDSKDGKHERSSFLPQNLSRPEIGEVAPAFELALSSRTEVVQHGPRAGDPRGTLRALSRKTPARPAGLFTFRSRRRLRCGKLPGPGLGRVRPATECRCRVGQVRRRGGVALKLGR